MTNLIKKLYTRHLNNLVEHYWNIYHFDMGENHIAYNNEGDAFKHCMFQAELTFWLGERIAKFFGDMHEDKPDNPEKEKEMDLHNNEKGREIGKPYFWLIWNKLFNRQAIYDDMAESIMFKMRTGELITEV